MQQTGEGGVGHQDVTPGGQRCSGIGLIGHAQRVAAGRHGDGVRLIVSFTSGWLDFAW